MDNKYAYDEWAEYAFNDYDTANLMYNEHWTNKELIICYHCQQSAEKYLKAYIVYHDINIEKTHDLIGLLNTCISIDKTFNTLVEACDYLTPFAIQVRYPFNSFSIGDYEQKKAIKNAKEIMEFVIKKVGEKDISD